MSPDLAVEELATSIGPAQDVFVVFGGVGLLIWLVWRLFWKVDRRSQQEIAGKNAEIGRLTKSVEAERTQRFQAQEREAKLSAEVSGLRQSVADLTAMVESLKTEIVGLKSQIGGSHATPSA